MDHVPVMHVEVSDTQIAGTFKKATIVGFQPRIGSTITIVRNLTNTSRRNKSCIRALPGNEKSKRWRSPRSFLFPLSHAPKLHVEMLHAELRPVLESIQFGLDGFNRLKTTVLEVILTRDHFA